MSNFHLAHHLSLGSSMIRASHRSSEGCGFDARLGLRNHFLSIELDDLSSLFVSLINMIGFHKTIAVVKFHPPKTC